MKTIIKTILVLAAFVAGTTINAAAADGKKASKKESTEKVAKSESSKEEGKIVHLTKAEFDKRVCNTNNGQWKYIGDKPCVIDFYATWCGPCKMISPYLERIAEKYKGQLYVYKIDVDKERELASMFGAYSIPLLIFVPQTGEPSSQRGALAEEDLENAVRKAVLGLPELKK